jgi:hypothetical protein
VDGELLGGGLVSGVGAVVIVLLRGRSLGFVL